MELKHFWVLYDDEASGLKQQVIARFGDVELPLGAYIGMYGARANIEGLTDLYIRRLSESLRVRRSQDRAGPRPNWSRWRSVEVRPRLGTYGREALIAALGRRVWSQASYARVAAQLLAQADKALGGGADQSSRAAPVSRGQRLRAERCAKLKADMMAILAKPKKRGRLSAWTASA